MAVGEREHTVVVELTAAQVEVLHLMHKNDMKLGIKVHEKEKPKQ
jgi:hypothetical protein